MRKITIALIVSGIIFILPACSNQTDLHMPQTSNDTASVVTSSEISPESDQADSPDQDESVAQTESAVQTVSTVQELYQSASAELFLEFDGAHGIVFDDKGNMFIGKKTREIYKVTPDAQISLFLSVDSLAEKTDRTKIWNMHIGPDEHIYAAAGDRILRINEEGSAETFILDDFAGEWGACDLAFDPKGNLYVVHDKMVERYSIVPDKEPEKTTLLDGRTGNPLFRAVVGICLDKELKSLYVSDVFGNKVVKCALNEDSTIGDITEYVPLRSAEYMEPDSDGNIYISLPAENRLVSIDSDGAKSFISADNLLKEPTTLAFGKDGFETGSLYVTAKGGVFRIPIEE